MGNEVFENMVNQNADRSRVKRERYIRRMLAVLAVLTLIAVVTSVAYFASSNRSLVNLVVSAQASFCAAFVGGRIWERTK